MPNHIHGLIQIDVGVDHRVYPNNNINGHNNFGINGQTQWSAPTVNPQPLSRIIKKFKTLTIKEYINGVNNYSWHPFNRRLWQRNYYEHIIRNEKDLNKIRLYIKDNPFKWFEDDNNPKNIEKKNK